MGTSQDRLCGLLVSQTPVTEMGIAFVMGFSPGDHWGLVQIPTELAPGSCPPMEEEKPRGGGQGLKSKSFGGRQTLISVSSRSIARRRHDAICAWLFAWDTENSAVSVKEQVGALTETVEVKAPKPLLATAAGHTHLYSDAHYQSHSTNALCTKAFLSVSSLSMTLTLLQDQLPNSQGPVPMGMWGVPCSKTSPIPRQ